MEVKKESVKESAGKTEQNAESILKSNPVQKPDTNVPFLEGGDDCIDSFSGKYEFLSNFYECDVTYNGITYHNSESAFQAQKDLERSLEFTALTAGQAKKLGKKVQLRSDWETVKCDIMEEIVRAKFTQNEYLKEKLLETGTKTLVEGNVWFDRFWGVCRGRGLNHLGMILMKIREELSNS